MDNNGNVQNHVMEKGEKVPDKTETTGGISKAASYMKRCSLVAIFLIVCLAAVVAARIFMNQYLYKKATNRQKIYYEVVRMEELIKVFGMVRKTADTWNEFMSRVQQSLPIEKGEEQSAIFSRMRYRGDDPGNEETAVFRQINEQLLSLVRQRYGKWKYYRIWIGFKLRPIRMKTR